MKQASISFEPNNFPCLADEIVLPDYDGNTQYRNGKRFYANPDGDYLPSISTVMGYDPEKEKKLEEWRERVGHDQAAKITKQSQDYGTLMHESLEHYLSNDMDALHKEFADIPKTEQYIPMGMFNVMKQFCDKNVEGVYHQERPVYSNTLGIAGRFDVLCKMNGVPVLMDFKNSRRRKKKEYVQSYILQSTAYATIITEHTGIEIEWFVIPVVTFDGELQVFTGKVSDHKQDMKDQVNRYYNEVGGAERNENTK